MRNNYTLKDKKIINNKDRKASVKTTNLLKMFARAYHVEKSLPSPINEVYVN